MFVSKLALPRRTVLRGAGAAIALPFLDAMIPALTPQAKAAATPRMRFGAVYFPNGAIMQQCTPKTVGAGFEFTPILKPLEPFKDPLVVVTNLTRSHPGSQVGDHAVSAAGFLTGVWPKRTEAEDVLANTTIDQVVAQTDRAGYAAPVAGTRHRGFHRLRRRLLAGLQLRLHEHDFVEHADDAAADGDQSARGVRTALRRAGYVRSSAARGSQKQRSILDSIAEDANDLERDWAARSRARQRLSGQRSRNRTAHPAERKRTAPRETVAGGARRRARSSKSTWL